MNLRTENIQNSIRDLFRIHTLPHKRQVRKYMGATRVTLADVGATGNPKGVWREASEFSTFLLFDPDPRAAIQSSKGSCIVYASGLWSEYTTKTLSLAVNPEASSVYSYNTYLIDDFLHGPLHNVVSSQPIILDSMKNVLANSEYKPDFIKVDAEGADLEILRGAEEFLNTSCLGVFAEISFAERHLNAPLFPEVDIYMRSQNFMLMDLYQERWIRTNAISYLFTRNQLIWGNALYILNRQEFTRRLTDIAPSKRKEMLAKFLLILLLYQLHDYSVEIITFCRKEGLVSDSEFLDAKNLITSAIYNGPKNIIRLIFAIVLSSVGMAIFLPIPRLWRSNLLFLKLQFGELCNVALRFSTHRYKGCVVDPVDPSSRI